MTARARQGWERGGVGGNDSERLTAGEWSSRCPSIFSSKHRGQVGAGEGRGGVAAEEVRLADRVTPTANWLNWEDRPKLAAARVAAVALCGPVFVATGGFKEK